MGCYSFKEWIVNRLVENQQVVEIKVADFLMEMIRKAGELLKRDIIAGQPVQRFGRYVRQVWPAQSCTPNPSQFLLPPQFPQGIANQYVKFNSNPDTTEVAEAHHYEGQFVGFALNMYRLNQAKSINDVDDFMPGLEYSLHHECEHIFHPGTDYDSDDGVKGALDYMGHDGEVRGHARAVAKAYSVHHPGESLDVEKVQNMVYGSHFNNTYRNYLHKFAHPVGWDEVNKKAGGNYQNPHGNIVKYIQNFLPRYQK